MLELDARVGALAGAAEQFAVAEVGARPFERQAERVEGVRGGVEGLLAVGRWRVSRARQRSAPALSHGRTARCSTVGESGQSGIAVARSGLCFDQVVDLHGWDMLALSDVEAGDWSERFDGGLRVAASEQEEAERAARQFV